MKHKVAILGAGGMLGSMVLRVLANNPDFLITATVRNLKETKLLPKYQKVKFCQLDAEQTDPLKLKKVLGDVDWVINCIGIIKHYIKDDKAVEIERALRVNALFPHLLAYALPKAKIIQIATDCVYSGKKGGYKESDPHDAQDVYGKSKSLGEVYLKNMYNIRCSIVGPEITGHHSFLDWFLSNPKGSKVEGYNNHFWNGITTYHFAKICEGIIKNNIKINHLQHIVASGRQSKNDLLKIFSVVFNRSDIKIISSAKKELIDRTLKTENQKLNKKIWSMAGYNKIPDVVAMIYELMEFIKVKK